MLRLTKCTVDKAKRIEAAGKLLEKGLKSAPNNREFKHNRELKAQRAQEEAFMSDLDRTHSKVYSNPGASFEYLRLKVVRPMSYAAVVLFAEEVLRTEISKLGYSLGNLHIDIAQITTDSATMAFSIGVLSAIALGQGFGLKTQISKDGYIAAIRQSKENPESLNFTILRNNHLFNTKQDINFVKQTDDAVYETTRIQKSSVSTMINQKYWYPTYFLTVDAENVEVLELRKKHALVRCSSVKKVNVNRMKDVEGDESFDLVLPLTGVKFDKYQAMRSLFGEHVVRSYMKSRKTKEDLE